MRARAFYLGPQRAAALRHHPHSAATLTRSPRTHFPLSTHPFSTPATCSFEAGAPNLDEVVWADNDPAAHKKRLAKLGARIQREAPEDWERIRKVEKLIENLEMR